MSYKITFICQNCRQTKAKVTARRSQTFCSNKCQAEKRQQELIRHWLATGHAPDKGSHKNHYIKKYLLEQQRHRCAVCSQPTVWNGHELIFIKDHIDGNSSNNDRTNLRLVCPNCDRQLPTFKSRNRGRGRFYRKHRMQQGKSF